MRRLRSEIIYLAAVSAALVCSCAKDNTVDGSKGNLLPEPKAVVSDVSCDSFKVSWNAVTDAGSYSYVRQS